MTLHDYIGSFRTQHSQLLGPAPHLFSGLLGFMAGYSEAHDQFLGHPHKQDAGAERDREFFDVFIRRTLNARHPEREYGSGLNWTTIILSEVHGDDRAAFYLFYELWDTYHQKQRKEKR
jgi:hypothetical protein